MIESDVVVIGGGVAGCVAAIRARELGASVVIVDKTADIVPTGDAGHGAAFLTAYLDSGEPWDTLEVFAEWYRSCADGLVDIGCCSARSRGAIANLFGTTRDLRYPSE